MPPIDIGPHGGGDLPQLPEHAHMHGHITDLHTSIGIVFDEAVGNAGADVAEKKSASKARLEAAFAKVQQAERWLTEVDNSHADYEQQLRLEEAGRREAERNRRQDISNFSSRIEQIQQDRKRHLDRMKGPIQAARDALSSELGRLEQVITETFRGLPETLAATEPGERKFTLRPSRTVSPRWEPMREAGELDAKLVVARMNIEALREQLRSTSSTASHTAEGPQADSPTANLPLGRIDLDTFLNRESELQHTLGNVIRLYYAKERKLDASLVQERFSLLSRALDGVPGDSALEKTENLCIQLYEFNRGGASWIPSPDGGYLSEDDVWERYGMLQFDLPLIFRDRGNNPS